MSIRDYLSTLSDSVLAFQAKDVSLQIQGLVGWVILDLQQRPVNVINIELMPQVEQLLDKLQQCIAAKQVYVVVFCSGKVGTFVAGADITAMFPTTDQQLAEQGSAALQKILNRIENAPVPSVAAINVNKNSNSTHTDTDADTK